MNSMPAVEYSSINNEKGAQIASDVRPSNLSEEKVPRVPKSRVAPENRGNDLPKWLSSKYFLGIERK